MTGKAKKAKFYDSFINFVFMSVGDKTTTDGQWGECHQVLANSNMNPARLKLYLERMHPELVEKNRLFLKKTGPVERK